MIEPWVPLKPATRLTDADFRGAADLIGAEPAALRAVWEVEAAGRGFRPDGSLERRFEPHHMPGSMLTWRDSLKLKTAARERMFREAFARQPEAAAKATSWGGPQIMGFNHTAAGFTSALAMVREMAKSEREQLAAFTRLVRSWGIDSALRAHDWLAFARRYNGTGQPEVYARRMEAAYRRHAGHAAAVVLRVGDRGAAVRRLQSALGVEVDGAFGPETLTAVQAFQKAQGLPVDGVVGARTWAALAARDARPVVQETPAEHLTAQVERVSGLAAAAGGLIATAREALPGGAYTVLAYGAVALALVFAGLHLARRWRA